jgi:xanthine dehydrogenase molybdenum-binding subunit
MRRIAGDSPFQSVQDARRPWLLSSWGVAAAYKNTGLGGGAPDKAAAEVELRRDGTFQVRTSSAELGQGLTTVLRLIAAEVLSVGPDDVHVLVMDTDLTPDGGPTTASRQTYVTGNAAFHAAGELRAAMISAVSEDTGCPADSIEIVSGTVRAGQRVLPMKDVSDIMRRLGLATTSLHEYRAPETKPLGDGGDMHFAFSFAAQAVQVEVNTRTGEVRVLRVIAANDVGKALNPLGLQGQVEGGVVMGLGHALTEEFIVEDGVPFTDHLARYRIPNITQVPEITSIVVEDATADGPFGAKGVGEIVSIPTLPAIANAIYNAVGARIDRLPVDQELVLKDSASNPGRHS